MDSSNIERISKALANETRLLIFEAIARNKEMTSSTIVTLRQVAAATVSHHLKILSHAGLIECRRQGQFVHNRAVPETIENYARELSRLSRATSVLFPLPLVRESTTRNLNRANRGGFSLYRGDRCFSIPFGTGF